MLYGIQASGSTMPGSIVRAIDDNVKPIMTEELRVLTCDRIRNMASLVLVAVYFSSAWIGRGIKRKILAEHLKVLSKRLDERPDSHPMRSRTESATHSRD